MFLTNSLLKIKDYVINYIFSLIFLPFTILFYRKLNLSRLKKIINKYLTISTIFLVADMIRRFILMDKSVLSFYMFKFHGIMFMDSNFSGFFAMINFAFSLYLMDKKFIVFSKAFMFLQFILILLNFSRAAIIATIMLMLFLFYRNQTLIIKIILVFMSIFIICFLFIFVASDASGASKINIFQKTMDYLKHVSIKQLLFGNGIGSSLDLLGIDAHNFISGQLIELGFISLSLHLLLYIFCSLT
jgi:hypothetical protein